MTTTRDDGHDGGPPKAAHHPLLARRATPTRPIHSPKMSDQARGPYIDALLARGVVAEGVPG